MRSASSVPVAIRFWSLLNQDWNWNVVKLCDVFAHEFRAQRGGELGRRRRCGENWVSSSCRAGSHWTVVEESRIDLAPWGVPFIIFPIAM